MEIERNRRMGERMMIDGEIAKKTRAMFMKLEKQV